jgi:amino-acid racemase
MGGLPGRRRLLLDRVQGYIGVALLAEEETEMKTIGLLGGMSWESSIEYERLINEEVRRRLGGNHSADLLIRSYDFAEIEALQEAHDWSAAGSRLAADARRLQEAGAELIVLCTNTMHRVADVIEETLDIPFIHLADTTARAVKRSGLGRVALLGTRYTMEQDFYRGRLEQRHGIEVIVPGEADRGVIHNVIYQELVRGIVREDSRRAYLDIIRRVVAEGAEGVVAGCTEIELLVTPDDVECPYFPTTRLHALAAVDVALDAPAATGTQIGTRAPSRDVG